MSLADYLASHPLAFVLCTLLLGLLVGSFLNVLVYRLPLMLQRDWQQQARDILALPAEPVGPAFNLLTPNSRCPHCGHAIRPWENIPLLSWLALRGRCSSCQTAISPRYPLVELACGLLSAFVAWHFGFGWACAAMLLLTWGLLAMSLIDADHQLLPDALVLPLLWLGLIVNAFGLFTSLEDALWGAVAGYLSVMPTVREEAFGRPARESPLDRERFYSLCYLWASRRWKDAVVSGDADLREHAAREIRRRLREEVGIETGASFGVARLAQVMSDWGPSWIVCLRLIPHRWAFAAE